MKNHDLPVTIVLGVVFFMLCMVFGGAAFVVSKIPTQDARAMQTHTISVPETTQ